MNMRMQRAGQPPISDTTVLDTVMAGTRPAVGLLVGFSIVANLFKLSFPIFLLQVVDRVLSSRNHDTLFFLTLIVVIALSASAVIGAVIRVYQTRLGSWVEASLLSPVIKAGVDGRLSNRSLGPQTLRDLTQVGGFFGNNILSGLLDLPWVIVFMTVIYLMSPYLGLVATGFAVVLITLAIIHSLMTRAAQDRNGDENSQASQAVARGFQNADIVHAMGMLPNFLGSAVARNETARKGKNSAAERGGALMMAIRGVRQIAQVAVLATGAYLVIEGYATAGVMIAGSILLGLAFAPIDQAANTWRGWLTYRDARARLKKQLAAYDPQASAGRAGAAPPRGELTAHDAVYFVQGQRRPAIKPVSLTIAPGEMVGVIGSSSSGKTVLTKMLLGLLPPSSGSVQLDGVNMHEWLSAGIGSHIGYQPQDLSFLAGTVGDNIARLEPASAQRSARIQAAAGKVGIFDTLLNLPQGLETDIDMAMAQLSRGALQQIALARAFYGDPQLIVLDEPTTFLDRAGESALVETLEDARARGATIVLVSQRSALMRACDKLILLREGVVDAYADPETVLERLKKGRQARGPANLRLASS